MVRPVFFLRAHFACFVMGWVSKSNVESIYGLGVQLVIFVSFECALVSKSNVDSIHGVRCRFCLCLCVLSQMLDSIHVSRAHFVSLSSL